MVAKNLRSRACDAESLSLSVYTYTCYYKPAFIFAFRKATAGRFLPDARGSFFFFAIVLPLLLATPLPPFREASDLVLAVFLSNLATLFPLADRPPSQEFSLRLLVLYLLLQMLLFLKVLSFPTRSLRFCDLVPSFWRDHANFRDAKFAFAHLKAVQ